MKNKTSKKELHKKINAYLYEYNEKDPKNLTLALQVINRLLSAIDPDFADSNKLEFELLKVDKLTNEYRQKVEELQEIKKVEKLLDTLESLTSSFIKDVKNPLEDKELDEYIQTL